MVKVYAVALAVGSAALIAWIFLVYLAGNSASLSRLDMEARFGRLGRRVVAALVGFGMAGLSAEFSPKDLSWPVALVLAILGAGGAVWLAGWVDRASIRSDAAERDSTNPASTDSASSPNPVPAVDTTSSAGPSPSGPPSSGSSSPGSGSFGIGSS